MGDGFEGMSGFDDIFMTWPETDQVTDGTDDLTSDITGKSLDVEERIGSLKNECWIPQAEAAAV